MGHIQMSCYQVNLRLFLLKIVRKVFFRLLAKMVKLEMEECALIFHTVVLAMVTLVVL